MSELTEVLLASDDVDNALSIQQNLKALGYAVRYAGSNELARALVLGLNSPEVAIVQLDMPASRYSRERRLVDRGRSPGARAKFSPRRARERRRSLHRLHIRT